MEFLAESITTQCCILMRQPITRQQILDASKLKEFADDNFKFDENSRKLSKRVENSVEKGEIAGYEQFLLFSQCFLKACFPGASKGVIVWEWVNLKIHSCGKHCAGKEKLVGKSNFSFSSKQFLLFSQYFLSYMTLVFSSTGLRPASLCHGLLSVVRPCVRPSVHPSVRYFFF